MKIKIRGVKDLRKLASGVREIDRHIPFATALALTKVAQLAQAAVVDEMKVRFDRPTPIVLRSMRTSPATKARLESKVFLKNSPLGKRASGLADVIGHQFGGGPRRSSGAEVRLRSAKLLPRGKYLVPSIRAGRDAFGNLPRAQIVKMLADLRGITPGKQAMSDRRRRRMAKQGLLVSRGFGGKRRTLDQQYFVTRAKNSEPLGIWRLVSKGKVEPFMVVADRPQYKQRIDIEAISRKITRKHFGEEFGRAFAKALSTGTYRGVWK